MKLKKKTIDELREIMSKDYGASLNNEALTNLGTTLLRLTRLAADSLARADESNSSLQARESSFLGANTSKE